MSVIKSKVFLQNLIQTGPDASLNLFVVNFQPHGDSEYDEVLSLRTTQFPTPKRDVETTSVVYQNIELKKIVPSSQIDRELTFNVRIDSYFDVLTKLRSKQAIDSNGLFVLDEDDSYTITVDALRPYDSLTVSEQYISTYRWVFHDAYIKSVGSMNFTYDSDATGSTTVTFVYGQYEEYPVDISMEQERFIDDFKTIHDGAQKWIAKKKQERKDAREAREQAKEAERRAQEEAKLAAKKAQEAARKEASMKKNYTFENADDIEKTVSKLNATKAKRTKNLLNPKNPNFIP